MDILGYLKSRSNELERVNHPFASRSLGFRYLYAYGIGVLALGNMKSMTELTDRYQFFLECIALPKEQREKILVDINNNFEFRLAETIKILRTKEVQYCFVLDLYSLYALAVWSMEYCEKVMENYRQIFHMSETEVAFFRDFHEAVQKKNVEYARDLYRDFRNSGFDIRYKMLQYFFPEFEMQDRYKSVTASLGKTVLIDKPTIIEGDILVERGGSLLFTDADVQIRGSILVDGGRVQILDSRLSVEQCGASEFLRVKDAAVVQIDGSSIDCNYQCGFLKQNTGRLLVNETEFLHSAHARMIDFTGADAKFAHCSFMEGRLGFIHVSKNAALMMIECDFFRAYAEYGAAIYSDSLDNVSLTKCMFRNCKVRYLGAAVYFRYQKLGQVVKECVCRNCEPETDAVFNTYEDDFVLKIR